MSFHTNQLKKGKEKQFRNLVQPTKKSTNRVDQIGDRHPHQRQKNDNHSHLTIIKQLNQQIIKVYFHESKLTLQYSKKLDPQKIIEYKVEITSQEFQDQIQLINDINQYHEILKKTIQNQTISFEEIFKVQHQTLLIYFNKKKMPFISRHNAQVTIREKTPLEILNLQFQQKWKQFKGTIIGQIKYLKNQIFNLINMIFKRKIEQTQTAHLILLKKMQDKFDSNIKQKIKQLQNYHTDLEESLFQQFQSLEQKNTNSLQNIYFHLFNQKQKIQRPKRYSITSQNQLDSILNRSTVNNTSKYLTDIFILNDHISIHNAREVPSNQITSFDALKPQSDQHTVGLAPPPLLPTSSNLDLQNDSQELPSSLSGSNLSSQHHLNSSQSDHQNAIPSTPLFNQIASVNVI